MRVNLAGIEIEARSVGGVETCYNIPSYDVCLDIGRCPRGAENRSVVLLTHAHIDHAAGLPYYVSMRALNNQSPPKIYCPTPSRDALQQILDLWSTLQAESDRCELIGVEPGDEIPLRKNVFARAFRSPHRIACTGYTIFRKKTKLRDEFAGLSHEEIARRANAGESVNRAEVFPELCYPGDTKVEVLLSEPTVTKARVLLLECTFFGPDVQPDLAKKGGHIHFDQLAEHADRFENEAILLTHFSRRHRPTEIREQVEQKLPAQLAKRVHLLMDED